MSATAVPIRPMDMAKVASGSHKANARAKGLGAAMPGTIRTAELVARDSEADVAKARQLNNLEPYLKRWFGLYILFTQFSTFAIDSKALPS